MYRIALPPWSTSPTPARVLAATADLSAADRAEIDRRLDRLDRASSIGPWTRAVLAVIAAQPATRAADLAAGFGRETLPFKTDVRKLKNLGLTESLEVGYRLSPRRPGVPRGRRLVASPHGHRVRRPRTATRASSSPASRSR